MTENKMPSTVERAVYDALMLDLDRRYREADAQVRAAEAPDERDAARRRRSACRVTFNALRADMALRGLALPGSG